MKNTGDYLNEIMRKYRQYGSVKECFRNKNTECSRGVIRAHSLQKNGILSQLESEVSGNKLIYALDEWITSSSQDIIDLKPIGKSKASIFTGFCDHHDKIFSPIENEKFNYTSEQCFLYTFRGFAHSYQQAIELDKYHKYIESQTTFVPLHMKNEHIRIGLEAKVFDLTVRRFNKYKMLLNEILDNKRYDYINYYWRTFDYTLFATSHVPNAEFTFDNCDLNRKEDFPYLVLNVIPDFDKTIVLLSHFPEDVKGKILLDNLKGLSEKDFQTAISSLVIFQGLNTYISPKLWNRIPESIRKEFINEINYLVRYGPEHIGFFRSVLNFFSYNEVG